MCKVSHNMNGWEDIIEMPYYKLESRLIREITHARTHAHIHTHTHTWAYKHAPGFLSNTYEYNGTAKISHNVNKPWISIYLPCKFLSRIICDNFLSITSYKRNRDLSLSLSLSPSLPPSPSSLSPSIHPLSFSLPPSLTSGKLIRSATCWTYHRHSYTY